MHRFTLKPGNLFFALNFLNFLGNEFPKFMFDTCPPTHLHDTAQCLKVILIKQELIYRE